MRAVRTVSILAVAAMFAVPIGCSLDEDEFPKAYADAVCEQLAECDRGRFESDYSDMEDCEDEWEEFAEDIMEIADDLGGDYSPEGGRDCVDAIRDATCEEFEEGEMNDDCEEDDVFED